MPKLTLVLGRKPMQAYDIEKSALRVGREPGVDIVIDNPSVSREHCDIKHDGKQWIVADLGSANGTFLNGRRIGSGHPLKAGDEIGIGKFSLLFEKEVELGAAAQKATVADSAGDYGGTMQIKAHEVEQLLSEASKKREAHFAWESGGQQGTHQFKDRPTVLVGMDDLCDVRVPKGPKHHLLLIHTPQGYEARNLAAWGKMTVRGTATKKARLKDGDVVEMAGLKLTFVDAL